MNKEFNIENHITKADLNFWKFPINDDFGKDLHLKNSEGRDAISWIGYRRDGYREVTLRVTSYGVDHYYGSLKCYDLNFTDDLEKIGKNSISGSFLKGIPEIYSEFFKLELKRPYDENDKSNDVRHGRDRWLGYEIGDLTQGFWEEDDVIEVGKSVFKKIFKGKWKLVIESLRGDKDEIIYLDNIK